MADWYQPPSIGGMRRLAELLAGAPNYDPRHLPAGTRAEAEAIARACRVVLLPAAGWPEQRNHGKESRQ